MAEQNRQSIKCVQRVKSLKKGMTAIRIVLSDGTEIKAHFPSRYGVSSFLAEAQDECHVTYQSDSITHIDALSYAKKAIAELLLA